MISVNMSTVILILSHPKHGFKAHALKSRFFGRCIRRGQTYLLLNTTAKISSLNQYEFFYVAYFITCNSDFTALMLLIF